ncbi:MAG TPA: carbohydrate ABC transporter permease [Bacilli bacterium]|nr:carbohydrate ABC transporter permease [Bacilli bacterium]
MEKNKAKELDLALTAEEKAVLAETGSYDHDDRFEPTFEKAKDYRTAKIIAKIITYGFLTLFSLFMLLPFVFMITVSLKSPVEYQREISQTLTLLTNNPTLVNFKIILGGNIEGSALHLLPEELLDIVGNEARRVNFTPYFINTAFVAVISTIFTIATTVLASFAFARLEFKSKNFLFAVLLATMMVPGEIMLITNYQTAVGIGWDNTFAALIFVHGVSVFYIFYLRQTFQQIPNELFLASKVDGYGEYNYLWRVMIPIAMPTIVTITILNVMGSWNAFMWPTLIASGNNKFIKEHFGYEHTMRLVSNGLMSLFSSDFSDYDTVKIAGSMVISAPLLLVFILFRQYIMRGVSRSGIKG